MKKKFSAVIAVLLCMILALGIFTACSVKEKNKDDDSTAATIGSGDSWQAGGEAAYQPIEVTGVELVDIVSKALGSDAKGFNGNISSLTPEQIKKVAKSAKEQGYVVDKDKEGNTVIKKDIAPTTQLSSQEVNEILSEANVEGSTKLTDEEYKKVSKAAEENSATALTNDSGDVEIIRTTYPNTPATGTTQGGNQSNTTQGGQTSTTKNSGGNNTTHYNPVTNSPTKNPNSTTRINNVSSLSYDSFMTFGGASHVLYNSCDSAADGVVSAGNTYVGKDGSKLANISGIVAKYNTKNKLQWMDIISGNDAVFFEDVAVLSDNSVVAVGQSMATNLVDPKLYKSPGTYEIVIVKYSANGDKLWTKIVGGSGTDSASCISAAPDGGFVLGGVTYSNDQSFSSLSSSHTQNAFIAKFDANGNMGWVKGYGGSNSTEINDVDVSGAGFIYVALETVNTDGDFAGSKAPKNKRHSYVMRLTPDGGIQWKNDFYESGSVRFEAITAASDDGCVVAGDYSVGSEGNAYSFEKLYNGGSKGSTDGIILAFGATGLCKWCTPLVGYENDHITGITPIPGGYALTGYTTSTNRDFKFKNRGDYDSFIYLLNKTGSTVQASSFGGSESDRAMDICAIGSTLYSAGCSASGDGSFAESKYKGGTQTSDGSLKTIAFLFKYVTEN